MGPTDPPASESSATTNGTRAVSQTAETHSASWLARSTQHTTTPTLPTTCPKVAAIVSPLSALGLHALHDALTHSVEAAPNHVDFHPAQLARAIKRSEVAVFHRYRIENVHDLRAIVK